MLLKYSQAQKRIKQAVIGKPQRTAGGMVKLTSGLMAVGPKIHHRKVIKVANKRPVALHRTPTAVKREQILVDPCENSNDSGLGFDHHLDYHHASSLVSHPALRFSDKETPWPSEESPEVKRRRLEIKLESDDANDNFSFPETVRQPALRTICVPVRGRGRVVVPVAPLTLTSQLSATSHNRVTQLLIVCQPEQQHRARYQTEGSRGAVKDRTGNSFPVVKLVGYDRPTTLQVFIGTDQGRVAPHMFYQACRVSGKNSTACVEKKIDGTIVIEVDVEPSKDMVVTCDCVGILKERNVDVEHRFPEGGSGRSKKKSTRCRMVFRTTITHPDGSLETLQVTSQPIVCTQPPGVPEICKKSLSSCSARGGQELFVLGKNFLKDTRVVFQDDEGPGPAWAHSVQPDKEFLQQSHLVCVVPPYKTTDITEPVSVRVVVESSGKASEPHLFLYLPATPASDHGTVLAPEGPLNSPVAPQSGSTGLYPPLPVAPPLLMPAEPAAPFLVAQSPAGTEEKVHSPMMWEKPVDMMMPPPPPTCVPIALRRSSAQMIVPEPLAPEDLKREVPDTVVESPKPMANVSDLSSTQQPSMETFRRFVTNNSLPSINVGNYLSNIEGNSVYPNKVMKSQAMNEMPRIIIPPPSVNKQIFSGDSSNLLTTVEPILVNQTGAMPFDRRNISVNSTSASQSAPDNLGVIVSSSLTQKNSPDSQMGQEVQQKPMSQTQSVGMDLLMSSAMNNRAPTMTERLDAFVNSAADSHISPNPTSPITETSVLNHPINDMNKLPETNIPAMMPASLPISPHTSPHSVTTNLNEGSLCSLLNSSAQASPTQVQVASGLLAGLEHHLTNPTQANMSNLIQSPTQVTVEQAQALSNLQASLGQQLSSPSVTPSHISHTDMNSMMQTSPQASSSQVQALSNLRASLEQQISPQTVNSTQLNHPDLNNLMQHSPQATANQGQVLSNLQVSLEQQLSSQTLSSSQINHPDLNSLMRSPSQDSRNDVRVMTNLQASLEHLSSQAVSPNQIINSESVQPRDLSLSGMGNGMRTSAQTSSSGVQSLSNLQASLECRLSSQVIESVQANCESLANGGIALNNLNSSLPTSPEVQAAVSQAQALSNFQVSLVEHHLSSQVMGSAQPLLESMSPSMHSPNINPSLGPSPQSSVNQDQSFSDLQMSLGHLTSQVLTKVQPSLETMTTGTLTLNNSVEVPPEVQVAVTKAQVLSNLQALEHHLTSQVLSQNQTSAESMMPLERLSNPVQTSPHQSPGQNLSSLQSSLEHLSSQVLSSTQANRTEALTSHSLCINNPQTVELLNSQAITSPVSNSVMLSPTSRHSPASVLLSPGVSMSSTPTMALSPTNLTIHNSQPIEMNSSNIVLTSSHSLLATDLSMNNPSALSLAPTTHQMQSSQNGSLPQNCIGQFEQVASTISQSLPAQVIAMNQYEQCQEVNKEPERKEYMMPSAAVSVQTPVPATTVKKCEEGMPLPHELTQMSEHDLISYINPSCFDTV